MAASYTFNTDEDTETRRRRRRQSIADLLMKNADAAPIQSPWQGAAKMVNAGISGFLLGREEKRDREASEARNAYGSKLSEELAGGGGASPVTAALAGKPMGGPIKLGGFEPTVARTLEFEGGLNPNDSNGTPSNFGINQKANPDVDVTKLTPQGATEIYRKRYWDAIGADKMDPRTAHVAFDTAVIAGPRKAKELLAASGGDPEKFLALREAFQNRLLAANPEKYGPYAKAWANRTATLRADVGVGGGGQPGGMMAVGGGGGDTTLAGGDTLQGRGMPDANRLMQIATDRNAPPEIRERAKLMLQSMPKPRDPLDEEARRIQVEKGRLELNKMRNPQAPPPPEAIQKLQAVGIDQPTMQAAIKDPAHPLYGLVTKAIGGSGVTVNNNNAINPGGANDKQIFDAVTEDAKDARAAVTGLQAIQEARKAVAGGAIFGAGADTRLGLQKVGSLLGVVNPEKIQNTETFRSAIAPQVAAMLKATVGTAQISNTDREFAEKAAGGNISLDEGTVKRLLTIMEKAGRGRVDAYNKRLNEVYPDAPDGKFRRERAVLGLSGVPEPTVEPEAVPAGAARKTIGGKTYEKRADGWYEVK
jgi:hypothetical protein